MAGTTTTMRALQFSLGAMAGGLEKALRLNTSASKPKPGPDQLLVKVNIASVNPVDYKMAELPLVNRFIHGGSGTPGQDFAGEVAAVGSSVSTFSEGQRVFGSLSKPSQLGTLAEYTLLTKNDCALLPDGVDFEQGATLGTVGQTAYQCIAPNVQADSGAAVFINGGSGGCGAVGIQIAKALGCTVTTTCSTRNVEFCKSLGADEVIDYTAQDIRTALRKLGDHHKYHLIVDNVGSSDTLFPICHEFTTPEAKYVQVGGSPSVGMVLSILKASLLPTFLGGGQRKYQFLGRQNRPQDMRQLAQWMKEGKVKTPIEKVYDLQDGAAAYQELKAGRTRGKILVRCS